MVTADQNANCVHRVAAGVGTSHRGLGSEWPLRAHANMGPAAAGWRHPPACRPAARSVETPPIWLAALLASQCHAVAEGEESAIHWNCASGRALYTNQSAATALIRPLGVELPGGGTLAVSWATGESAYTLEILTDEAPCRA